MTWAPEKNTAEILSGRIGNCYVRLYTAAEPAVLEIFFPKSADEDRWGTRDILNEPYITKKEWIDSGMRLFLDLPPGKAQKTAVPLAEKIAAYFTGKYPADVFRHYKHYTSGKMSKIILLHINQTIVLKYCEELRADFTKNFCKVIFNEAGNCEKVYINTYEAGTLEYKNGLLEMHRWENEDEAQAVSYLSKRYTQRLLNGVIEGMDIKARTIGIIRSSMSNAAIETEDRRLFENALDFLEKRTPADSRELT
jgi:hypothetical protein